MVLILFKMKNLLKVVHLRSKTMKQVEFIENSWLKKSKSQSSVLSEDQKFFVSKGTKLNFLAFREDDSQHDFITFDKGYGSKNYNTWYVFRPHVKYEGLSVPNGLGILTSTDRRNEFGELLLNLQIGNSKFTVGSGQPNTSPVYPTSDFAGSMRPIPEGIYKVDKPQRNLAYLNDRSDGIGAYWIPLYPLSKIGGRNGFLIHMDWNRSSGALGTAGCIYPFVESDYFLIENAVNNGTFTDLKVDYKFGTV